jgi:hypothetical protein
MPGVWTALVSAAKNQLRLDGAGVTALRMPLNIAERLQDAWQARKRRANSISHEIVEHVVHENQCGLVVAFARCHDALLCPGVLVVAEDDYEVVHLEGCESPVTIAAKLREAEIESLD